MKLIHRDIEDIRLLFEDALKRTKKVDRIEKIKITLESHCTSKTGINKFI
jgi:hypothetical protein